MLLAYCDTCSNFNWLDRSGQFISRDLYRTSCPLKTECLLFYQAGMSFQILLKILILQILTFYKKSLLL